MIRQITFLGKFHKIKLVKNEMLQLIKNGKLFKHFYNIHHTLKHQSSNLIRAWSHRCECVLAHRLQKGQQMFNLYSKLWNDQVLLMFLRRMRHQLFRRKRDLIYGAVGVATYNWDKNRISLQEMQKHSNEMHYIHLLRKRTFCQSCPKGGNDCTCPNAEAKDRVFDNWIVFIEKNDLIVWRRKHLSGHYEYKVYGSYRDVSAEDFLNVQIDINYRQKWDTTAVALHLVEKDPEPLSNSDVIYWEMLWPRLFTNRDYVFKRRFFVDQKSKIVYLISKSTEHPRCPKLEQTHRVADYWSCMVIKPYTELNKPGVEFSLTYFDNPGVNIPATVTTWVAMRAMPDFLNRLRDATRQYKAYCQKEGVQCIVQMSTQPEDIGLHGLFDYFDEDIITDNTIFEAQDNVKWVGRRGPRDESGGPLPIEKEGDCCEEVETVLDDDASTQTGQPIRTQTSHNFWKYFHPKYYFN